MASNIIYKITYTPHLGTDFPKYYIGSKYSYTGNYYGSPSSIQVFPFTGGMPLYEWWKKRNVVEFKIDILEELPQSATPHDLVERELYYHKKYNVVADNNYFNMAMATLGWVSVPRTEHTKNVISTKTKDYWNSAEGIEKKKRLAERNSTVHSECMKKRWQNPTEDMIKAIRKVSKMRPSEETKSNMSKSAKRYWETAKGRSKKCLIKGEFYKDAIEASKHLGIHHVNVRRRCRLEKFVDWRYV